MTLYKELRKRDVTVLYGKESNVEDKKVGKVTTLYKELRKRDMTVLHRKESNVKDKKVGKVT